MLFGPRDCVTSPRVLPLDQRAGISVRAAVSGNADLERALNGSGVVECGKICVRARKTAKSQRKITIDRLTRHVAEALGAGSRRVIAAASRACDGRQGPLARTTQFFDDFSE